MPKDRVARLEARLEQLEDQLKGYRAPEHITEAEFEAFRKVAGQIRASICFRPSPCFMTNPCWSDICWPDPWGRSAEGAKRFGKLGAEEEPTEKRPRRRR